MIFSWNIKKIAKASTISNLPFKNGDDVISFVFKAENSEVYRVDISSSEKDSLVMKDELLGYWQQIFDEKEKSVIDEGQKIINVEAFFDSLFSISTQSRENLLLKQFTALYLERKKILRRQSVQNFVDGEMSFINTKTKKRYSVRDVSFTPQDIVFLNGIIEMLLN